jgi:hypothetical protein
MNTDQEKGRTYSEGNPATPRRGGAKPAIIIGLVVLIGAIVPLAVYIVANIVFPNGSTGANLSIPDTGVTVHALTAVVPNPPPANSRLVVRMMDLLVIDQATKQPIPSLTAEITTRNAFTGRTGVDGHVRIPLPAESHPDNFNIRVSGKNYVPKRLYWSASNPDLDDGIFPAAYTMEMERGTRIHGKIVDDAGQPVAGATIILRFTKRYPNPHEQIAAILGNSMNSPTKSDAEGNWSFSAAPSNCDEISLAVCENVIGDRSELQPFTPVSKLYDGTATLTLHRGRTVSGSPLEPQGAR